MGRKFLKGNEAVAEAAVLGGCRFFAGYPITPQNEIPEYLSDRLPQVGGAFVQSESEVAAINMIYGAAAMGTLAMTSSSSPGISLYSEGISYLAGAQLPAVIVSVSRGGPGLGAIQPAQADYLQATKAMGHGGFHTLVYAPYTIQEAVDLTYKACQKAEEYQYPTVVLLDGFIGSAMEAVELPEGREPLRKKYTGWGSKYLNPNHQEKMVVTSCLQDPENQEQLNIRSRAMYDKWAEDEVMAEEYMTEDAEYIIAAYGTAARTSKTVIEMLRSEGIKIGLIRPICLYPFPKEVFARIDMERVKHIFDVEMSIPAQMIDDVKLAISNRLPVTHIGRSGGMVLTEAEIRREILKQI